MAGITWRGLEAMQRKASGLGELVARGANGRATEVANEAELYMVMNAPWTDQTGEARRRLFARAEPDGHKVNIVFGHGVFYGIFLETKNGGRFAIVTPTWEMYGPILMRRLQGLL